MSCLQKRKKELYTWSFCEKTFEFKSVFLRHQKTHDILIPSFIYQNEIIPEHDTANDLRDETIPQHQPDTKNGLSKDIAPEDKDLMVPHQHLNISQSKTPLIQHLNQAETPPNHGDLSQAEAPNDITVRPHNINLNQSSNVGRSGSKQWKEIISHTDATDAKEAEVYQCFIAYLKTIQLKRHKFMTSLFDIFGIDRLNDSAFIYFMSSQLNLNYSNLRRGILRWIDSGMREGRGRWSIDLDTRQQIYNLWIEHS